MSAALAVAGLVTAAYALPRQEVAAVRPTACDVTKIVNAYYCPKCNVPVPPAEVAEKDGKKVEPGTDHEVKPRECCEKVKRVDTDHAGVEWLAAVAAPEDHKGCATVEKAVLSLTIYRCDDCGATADDVGKFRHKLPDCKGTPHKSCKDSGRFPHIPEVM